jgi:hypothetical protein
MRYQLQQAFDELGIEFNATLTWDEINEHTLEQVRQAKLAASESADEPAKTSEKTDPSQEDKNRFAKNALDFAYNYPHLPETQHILKATPKALRDQFLASRDKDYLSKLAASLPYFGASEIRKSIEAHGIDTPNLMRDLQNRGQELAEATPALTAQASTALTNLTAAAQSGYASVSGYLSGMWYGQSAAPTGESKPTDETVEKDEPSAEQLATLGTTHNVLEMLNSLRAAVSNRLPIPTLGTTSVDGKVDLTATTVKTETKADSEQSSAAVEKASERPTI